MRRWTLRACVALWFSCGLGAGCSDSYVIAHGHLPDAAVNCLEPCMSPLPRLPDVQVTMRGDTAILEFPGVPAAADYRVFVMPEASALERDDQGRQIVRDAIYRCAGKRTVADRSEEYGALYPESLVAPDNGYARSEAEATLGYVFLQPGRGRLAVHRLADPNGAGGYANADWIPPLYREANSAEYAIDPERRAELLRMGFRDDGIAFYAPDAGDVTVHRIEYQPDAHQGSRASFYFTDGPEHLARTGGDQSAVLDFGARFTVHATAVRDAVPLRRVTYRTGSTFDVLAAGAPAYQRALHQGGAVTALAWSGLTGPTTLVVEALDAGCPFPGAHVGAFDTEPEEATSYPTRTLDALRSPDTGEVFVNGQHDPSSRPAPIARAFVEVAPRARPALDFEARFDDPDELADMTVIEDSIARVYRNARWSLETSHCGEGLSFGAVLGQLFLGVPRCRLSLVPRAFTPHIARTRFLHVRMASDLPSTGRRFPQLLITTARSPDAAEVASVAQLPIHERLGPLAPSQLPGAESSIVVQTHFSFHEPQIQFCSRRGWGTTAFCPRANLYGFNAGEPDMHWTDERWLPVPVVTDRVGFDRPVQLDVYASTERVYLFIDDQPIGCAQLPADEMPEGAVTVAFGAVVDEPEKDEVIRGEPGRTYEREFSPLQSDRRMDDLGIAVGVAEPAWDESRLPCATRWYGGRLVAE